MARLPRPGSDAGTWAALLNEFLLVAQKPDGTLRATKRAGAMAATVGLGDLRIANSPTDPPIKTPDLSHNGTDLLWRSTSEINVRDFGAKGDGVTEDTDAIQAAIDVAGDGGNVRIPAGTFMIRGLNFKRSGTRLGGDARWGTRLVRIS